MKVEIPVEELRKRKIFFATPMYGGMCGGQFTKCAIDFGKFADAYGVETQFFFLFNESLIPRARNYLVDEFLRSDCTHFMFVDADIGFDPNDILTMAALMDDASPYDVMCGPYPKKCISWEKIKHAVDIGAADDNPENLSKFVGDFVLNPIVDGDSPAEIPVDDPVEVMEGGTGFMMVRRATFEKFIEAYPEQRYKPDHVRTKHFDGSRYITAFFDTVIDRDLFGENTGGSERYLSEDYMFCQYVRKAGMKIWLCPWMKTSHMGTFMFSGSLQDLASIGVSPTADASKLVK